MPTSGTGPVNFTPSHYGSVMVPTGSFTPSHRAGGRALLWPFVRLPFAGTWYNVYGSPGPGQPIAYDAQPLATTQALTWTSGPLAVPGAWSFGVRAANASGEEQNLDCAATIVFDSAGRDITNIPGPPIGLRAFATAGAGIRVEWAYPPIGGAKAPTGFHVYIGAGSPNYSSPAATVAADAATLSGFQVNLSSLIDGTTYSVGVRAYNASGAEQNQVTVGVTTDGTGPLPVASLTATAIP